MFLRAAGFSCALVLGAAAALLGDAPDCRRDIGFTETDMVTRTPDGSKVPAQNLDALGRELSLELPQDSRLVGVEREPRGDEMVRAKLVMTRAGWARFIAASPIKVEHMDPGTGGFLGQDHGWWDPHVAPQLRTGQIQREPGRFLNIGFDDSRPESVTVYIVQHGT